MKFSWPARLKTLVSEVVAPPYDQIGPAMQDVLYGMSAANIVRVTLPKDPTEGEGGGDRYAAARQTLDGWMATRTWSAEERAAIYPYTQTYRVGGHEVTRAGFIALGEVSEYGRGIVRPHERTHAEPKADRLRLLEATGADTGLLFMLVSDPDGALRAATAPGGPALTIGEACAGAPVQFALPTDNCRAVATRMARHRLERLPVVRDAESMALVGVVTRSDLIKPSLAHFDEEEKRERLRGLPWRSG